MCEPQINDENYSKQYESKYFSYFVESHRKMGKKNKNRKIRGKDNKQLLWQSALQLNAQQETKLKTLKKRKKKWRVSINFQFIRSFIHLFMLAFCYSVIHSFIKLVVIRFRNEMLLKQCNCLRVACSICFEKSKVITKLILYLV